MKKEESTSPRVERQVLPPAGLSHARIGVRSAPIWALFVPVHYEPGYPYPLIVWLHGEGETERSLYDVVPRLSVRNFMGLAIRSGSTDVSDPWPLLPQVLDAAMEDLQALIHAVAQQYRIDFQRVYVMGGKSGGTMATALACQDTRFFAGAINLGGAWPPGFQCRIRPATRPRIFWAPLVLPGDEAPLAPPAEFQPTTVVAPSPAYPPPAGHWVRIHRWLMESIPTAVW